MILDRIERTEVGELVELSARARPADGDGDLRLCLRSSALPRDRPVDASPFLPVLLMWCMASKEPLAIDGEVSARLLEYSEPAMAVCHSFWRWLEPVRIEATGHVQEPGRPYTASCFSRGVDSWFSLLEAEAECEGARGREIPPLTRLVHLPGVNLGLNLEKRSSPEVLQGLVEAARDAAARSGLEFVTLESNLYATLPRRILWGELHGAVLASAGLALGPSRMLIPSSPVGDETLPNGSHPQLDPLFSTETTEIVHHGQGTRLDKVKRIAESSLALQTLRVCPDSPTEINCGRCEKCLRTMVELHVAGALDRCPTFDRPLDPALVAATSIGSRTQYHWRLCRRALGDSRFDRRLAAAIQAALLKSDLQLGLERMRILIEELKPLNAMRSARPDIQGVRTALRQAEGSVDRVIASVFADDQSPPQTADPSPEPRTSRKEVRRVERARRRAKRRA